MDILLYGMASSLVVYDKEAIDMYQKRGIF